MGRTELVKLVYLADNRFYESTGRTITGVTYMWDHYGPNAVGHAIASEADRLVSAGLVRMSVRRSVYGGDSFQYRVDDSEEAWRAASKPLDEGERQVLMDIVKQFGKLPVASLVGESKRTPPFRNARQYGLLALEQDRHAEELREEFGSNGQFLEEGTIGLRDADEGRWVAAEDLLS